MAGETDFLQLVESIYDAATDASRWPGMLEGLSDHLGGAQLIMCIHKGVGAVVYSASARMDPNYKEILLECNSRDLTRPMIERLRALPVGTVVVREESYTEAQWQAREAYRSSDRPQNLDHGIAMCLLLQGDYFVALGAVRDRDTGPFNAEEKEFMGRLAPHLHRAVRILMHCIGLELQRDALEATLDRASYGVILVNRNAEILSINQRAKAIIGRADGLSIVRNRLGGATPFETRPLHELIDAAASAKSGGLLTPRRPSMRRPLSVFVAPLGLEGGVLADSQVPIAAIFVSDPEEEDETPADTLARLYGLTPKQAALAGLLLQGMDLKGAAERLGVTANTVHTHLNQIFAKMGVSRQADVVRLMLRSLMGLHFGASAPKSGSVQDHSPWIEAPLQDSPPGTVREPDIQTKSNVRLA